MFFSSCTGSQPGAKSSIFEHNSASSSVSPSGETFKDPVAKGHSSFNDEVFDDFSARIGSLEHAPVPGKPVGSPSCGSLLHRSAPSRNFEIEFSAWNECCA